MQDVELNIIKGSKSIVSSLSDEGVHLRLTNLLKELESYPDCAPKAFLQEAQSYCSERSLLQFITACSVISRTAEDYVPRLFTNIIRDKDDQPAFAAICDTLMQKKVEALAPSEIVKENIQMHSRRTALKRMAGLACFAALPFEFADNEMLQKTAGQKACKMARIGAEAGVGTTLALSALNESTQANMHRAVHLLDALIQNRIESVRSR